MATSWRFGRVLGNFDPSVFRAKNDTGDDLTVLDTSDYDSWSPKPGVMKWVFELRGNPTDNPGDNVVRVYVPIPVADQKTFPSAPIMAADHVGPSRPVVLLSPMSVECYTQQVYGRFSVDFTDPENPLGGADILIGLPAAGSVNVLCVIDFSHSSIN